MPENEIEVRFKLPEVDFGKIAKILRDAADKFERGQTRFVIADASGLIGGAVLDFSGDIDNSRRLATLLEDNGIS